MLKGMMTIEARTNQFTNLWHLGSLFLKSRNSVANRDAKILAKLNNDAVTGVWASGAFGYK